MLCHSHKFIDIHVPKSGGTSRKEALLKAGCVSAGNQFDHATWRDLRHWFDDPTYYKFSFRRNPAEIAVSLYHYNRDIQRDTCINLDFADWLQARFVCPKCPWELSDHLQFWGNIRKVDIFRFEEMAEVWPHICGKIGVEAPLIHINASHWPGSWRDYFDADLSGQLKDRFAADIALLGWPGDWEY